MKTRKRFNVTGLCIPKKHYMADTSAKIEQIVQKYIVNEAYFTINRARQYGKTTTLELLYNRLKREYIVLDMSFEGKEEYFLSLEALAGGLCLSFWRILRVEYASLADIFREPIRSEYPMQELGDRISALCEQADKKVILMIDEVDKAADNQVFLSFLGLLRDKYLAYQKGRDETFCSVILAGVHDIKNMKIKIRPEEQHSYNSPWNVAASFDVDMSFSVSEIVSMLQDYENDCHTGMDITKVAEVLYEYTNGYPFLVSCLCKQLDENEMPWNKEGLRMAVKQLLETTNTLFDDIIKNLENFREFRNLVEAVLLQGADISYVISNPDIARGVMYGIFRNSDGRVRISNRIFEAYIYEYLISVYQTKQFVSSQYADKSQYISDGKLNMEMVLQRFAVFMKSEYRDEDSSFIEQQGRLLFLSFLRPIINGTGHYAVEPETRRNTRMDIQVFYGAQELIVELKIWHGEKYEQSGYEQLAGYLEARNVQRGYLLSFCDNRTAPRQNRIVQYKGHEIYEVVVAYRDKI